MSASKFTTGDVAGHCPMGCGETLFLGVGGRVTCRYVDCPEPSAVDQILGDHETEHVVEFSEGRFEVRHPLRERTGDQIMTCPLFAHVASMSGPPIRPGRYRAYLDRDDQWSWHRLGGAGQ